MKAKSKHLETSNPSEVGQTKRSNDIIKQDILINLMNGIPLTKVCSSPDFPVITPVYQWMTKDEKFSQQVTAARMNGAMTRLDHGHEELEKLSHNKNKNHTDVAFINTYLTQLRWEVSKLVPAFNDKVVNEHKGDVTYKIGWDMSDNVPISNQQKKSLSHTT